jgi:hypothetical protein
MNHKIQNYFNPKIFDNKKISLEAKGLYMVILANIDSYLDYTKLHKLSSNNRVNTQRTLIELVNHGFVIRSRIRDADGISKGWKYSTVINEQHTL